MPENFSILMIITEETVKKLAHLARMKLTEAEVEKFTHQLDDILSFFDKLQEVDTEGIEPVAQVTGLQNIAREDVVAESNIEKELLESSPRGVTQGQIRVQKTF